MDKLVIKGGTRLEGTISLSGAKNAVLPQLAAALMTPEKVTLQNVPDLSDVISMTHLLQEMGVMIKKDTRGLSHTLTLTAPDTISHVAPYDAVRKMRASILVLGPLLARFRNAHISLPGGCAIGSRPVDLHLKGLEKLGATIELEDGYVKANAPKGLKGADITFPFVSVGATENLMMAAALASGTTRLINAAREPEITALGNLLNSMGAKISGLGSDIITIEGVSNLHGATASVIVDRIEMGTYIMATAITQGNVFLENADLSLIPSEKEALEEVGIHFDVKETGVQIKAPHPLLPHDITTAPFPGFATDLQAQFMTLMCLAKGTSCITESIFENRFMHVAELNRLGAHIDIQGKTAVIKGVDHFKGAPVMATDLRASVSLVLAGMVAEGETIINRIYHLDRGYSHIDDKLRNCGADIKRLSEN